MPIGECTDFLDNFSSWHDTTTSTVNAMKSTGYSGSASVTQIQQDIMDASLCVGDAVTTVTNTPNNISQLHEAIADVTEKLEEAEKDIEIAKNRVAYVRHPEQQTSNYESWFPINRPIHVLSLIVLMSLSIFMGIFFLLVVFSQLGFDLMLYIPNRLRSGFFSWLSMQFTWSFGIVFIILISVLLYYTYR
jgi:hypothetical protein